MAYNLYLLAHNLELQSRLIKRLKNPDQFIGAYYETSVAAVFIQAGFDLELENEEEVSNTHCEFTATFKDTGNKYSVEAKARQPHKSSSIITNQIYHALQKKATYPRVVFIEVNVSETADTPHHLQWVQDAIGSLRTKEETMTIDGLPAPEAYIFVTNHPFQYVLETTGPSHFIIGEGFKIPDFKVDSVFSNIREALQVRKKHYPMFKLIDSVKAHHEIPSTFDGEIPELAFGDSQTPRLKIGEKYSVPGDDQNNEVMGILKDACILETEKLAIGQYELGNGKQVIVSCPITDEELAAYQKYPDTFFGVYRPKGKKIQDQLDMFDFFFETYRQTPKEKLLEFLKDHPDFEKLKEEPQNELAITYCERLVFSHYKSDPNKLPSLKIAPKKPG